MSVYKTKMVYLNSNRNIKGYSSKTCICGHMYSKSPFLPCFSKFTFIEPLLRGHIS